MTRRSLPLDRVRGLLADARGLDTAEVRLRFERHGPNAIVESAPSAWADLARDTARDPMIWFLAAVAVVYALVGQRTEAVTLLLAIAPLVGMDVFLHRRTQASTEGLRSRLAAHAMVVRDGAEREVAALEVVPGDLVVVTAGEAFPADGIVLAGDDLKSDESTLTGEAYPVDKRPLPEPPQDGGEAPVAAEHWVFAGTRLLTGRAAVRVAFTGGETLYGEIVRSAHGGGRTRTPLQRAIDRLVAGLVALATVACLLLAAVRLAQGYGWVDAVVSAITLASAALPEEFPVVFTFFLGVGVYRLARRQALVRRAVSVENIGRVSCICSDKTGTITEGRLTLTHLLPVNGQREDDLLALAALASRREGADPLDAAVLFAAGPLSLPRHQVLATFPFTGTRKRETAVVRDEHGVVAVTKGAAETVLALCALDEAARAEWSARVVSLAADGHKVIACGWRPVEHGSAEEPGEGYRLAGVLAFEDPVRKGVHDAIAQCRAAGIHTVMVTGDHPLTARAVAREIGLGGPEPRIVSGEELESAAAAGGGAGVRSVDVVARATPAQKLTLVRALQRAGEVVAVTGDGVNDVPALQAADIGVAMGERGTRSAREVAAIVLLDDNFRTIVGAIAEGRQLFRNLALSYRYLLMIHTPLVVAAAALPLAGYPLLFLPVHIVWLELIIHPTALLVFQELPASGRLEPESARPSARFFSAAQWASMLAVGALLTVIVVTGYLRSGGADGDVAHGRSMAMATLSVASAAVTAALSRLRTRTARLVTAGTVLLSAALIQAPGLAAALHVTPLHLDDWGAVAAGGALAGLLVLALERATPTR
jgi:Ca2+-transporting ATPase